MDPKEKVYLAMLRSQYPRDDYMQGVLGPMEHGQFAQEWTSENPFIAAPSLAVAIPAYTVAKALGLMNNRSPASMDEIFAGYEGILRGLK